MLAAARPQREVLGRDIGHKCGGADLGIGPQTADESPGHETAARGPFDLGDGAGPFEPVSGLGTVALTLARQMPISMGSRSDCVLSRAKVRAAGCGILCPSAQPWLPGPFNLSLYRVYL